MMLDQGTTTHYKNQPEVYRTDRYGKVRTQDSPGHPRGIEMKIAEWIDANESSGKSRVWLATEMGVHPGTVDQWCSGRRKPKLDKILKIQELTGGAVTPHDWITLAK